MEKAISTTMRMGALSLTDQGEDYVLGWVGGWFNENLIDESTSLLVTLFSDGLTSGDFTSWIENRALVIPTQPTSR